MNTTRFAITLAGIVSVSEPGRGRGVRCVVGFVARPRDRSDRRVHPHPAAGHRRPGGGARLGAGRPVPADVLPPVTDHQPALPRLVPGVRAPGGPGRGPGLPDRGHACSTTRESSRGPARRSRWRCRSTSRSSTAASRRSPTTSTPRTMPATSGTSARTSTTSRDGSIGDTHGTWIAGVDGPAAMIMPADPQPGDVYRPENIPGLVFEEVTVKKTGWPFRGPFANGSGALVISELHMDGGHEAQDLRAGVRRVLHLGWRRHRGAGARRTHRRRRGWAARRGQATPPGCDDGVRRRHAWRPP